MRYWGFGSACAGDPVLVVMLALMLGVFVASNIYNAGGDAASGQGDSAGGNDSRGAALLTLVGTLV